jgi:hypothetical protein
MLKKSKKCWEKVKNVEKMCKMLKIGKDEKCAKNAVFNWKIAWSINVCAFLGTFVQIYTTLNVIRR